MKKQSLHKPKSRTTKKSSTKTPRSVAARKTPTLTPTQPTPPTTRLMEVLRATLAFWVRHYRKAVFVLCAATLFIYLGIVGIQVLSHALVFDGFAMNGAFQGLNPLRRIAEGQIIGRDFQFFHGLGIPLLHYPFFWLFGSDLTASEIARWSLQPLMFASATVLFFFAAFKQRWVALLASALAILFCLWKLPGIVYPENSSLGLRSLMPVVVMTAVLYRQRLSKIRLGKYISAYNLALGILLPVAFIGGTEQGVAAGIAFTVVSLIFPRDVALRQRLLDYAKTVGIAVLSLLIILNVVTLGHPLKPLQFTLINLPADQGWYFGVPPNEFLHYSALFRLFVAPFNMIVLGSATLLALLLYRMRNHSFIADRLEALLFGLITGSAALISIFGYFASAQFIPLARMSLLVAIVVGAYGVSLLAKKFAKSQPHYGPIAHSAAAAILIIFGGYLATTMVQSTINQFSLKSLAKKGYHHFILGTDSEALGLGWQSTMHAFMPIINDDNYATFAPKNDDTFVNGVSLEKRAVAVKNDAYAKLLKPGQIVYLPLSGRHHVASVETTDNAVIAYMESAHDLNIDDSQTSHMIIGERLDKSSTRLWSTYTALFETEMKTLQPSPGYDYIIHALGKEARHDYVARFDDAQPEFVTTMRRDYAVFEEWIQYTSWDFYQRVIENYEPVTQTGSHILWQRKPDQAWQKPDYTRNAKPLTRTGNRIKLPVNNTDKPKLVIVTVEYTPQGVTPKLPFANKSPRYLLTPRKTVSGGAVTLPPYETKRSFGIFLSPQSNKAYLDVETYSLVPGAKLDITDAQYQEPAISAAGYQGLLDQGGPMRE